MIWTVILKSGESFVVYGTVPSMSEVWKAFKPRGIRRNQVAGIIQGNHEVMPCPPRKTESEGDYYSRITKARQSAMAVPRIRDSADDAAFESWDKDRQLGAKTANDPIDW